MTWARLAFARLLAIFQRKRLDRDLEDEVRFHLDAQIEDNLKAGMDREEARYAAMRSFGGIAPMKEQYREQRTFAPIEAIVQETRYALRVLRRSPGFTITSVTVLALAIGANTAIFSVLNAILFRPLPYRAPEQLAMLWTSRPSQNLREGRSAYWNIEMWRHESKTFADMAVFDGVSMTRTGTDQPSQISVARVSPNLFPLLGIQPFKGRTFSTEEAERRERLALISHRFWQSHFGGSNDAIGSSIELDGRPSRIIGVLPASFQFPKLDADVWEPHTMFPDWDARRRVRGTDSWFVVGRLRPSVTIEQAQAEMSGIERALDEQLPTSYRNLGIYVVPLAEQVTGYKPRLALWMLATAVFCVLLIATTNIASLSLVRAVSREREMAIRAALGASRVRIIRQLFAEGMTLALISGLLGLFVADAGIQVVLAIRPGDLARLNEVNLDMRVLGWALVLCVLTGILVGLTPAIPAARRNLRAAVDQGGRSIAGGMTARGMRRFLVITEFALAIVLLVGAGLLMRSLWSIEQVDPGFHPDRVLAIQVASPAFGTGTQLADFYDRVVEKIGALPGVSSAGIIGDFFIGDNPDQILTADGRLVSERLPVRRDEISRGFFQTVGTPLIKGRFFSTADGPDSPRVAIINDALARRLWPSSDPLGRRVRLGRDTDRSAFTVVGVVGNMRRHGLEDEAIPQIFEPLAQNPSRHATLLVRTSLPDSLKVTGTVQAAVHQLEKRAALYSVTTLDNRLGAFLSERRFQTSLLIGFAVAALLMAAIGIYGLIQYSITTRTHEIAIRVAVGAPTAEIFRMIMREGLALSLTGLGLGLVAVVALSRLGSKLLYGITATDPVTYISVSLLLMTVAAAACYFPARRAMKLDPIVALRQD